jgi:hypothetical protein
MSQTDPRGQHCYYQAGKRLLEAIFTCSLLIPNACSQSPQESTVQQAARLRAVRDAAVLQHPLPDCPPENASKPASAATPESLREQSSANHHHNVVLAWKASSSSTGPMDPAVGYCLYRSRQDDITANDLDRCNNCKRINRRPIVGTACVDQDVQDGHTYYYAVASIRSGSALSSFSNKTIAMVPSTGKSPQSVPPYPSCDGENSTQAAPPPKH